MMPDLVITSASGWTVTIKDDQAVLFIRDGDDELYLTMDRDELGDLLGALQWANNRLYDHWRRSQPKPEPGSLDAMLDRPGGF